MAKFKTSIKQIDPDRVRDVHVIDKSRNLDSFVTRDAEIQLRNALKDRQRYLIALHGASKQGKSSILRSVFDHDVALHLELGAEPSTERIYRALVIKTGARMQTGFRHTDGYTWGVNKVFVGEKNTTDEVESEFVRIDLGDVNAVADIIIQNTTKRIIVVDNFHHVGREEQSRLAKDFTCFGARGFKVVIAGTWKQADYLVSDNTDLSEAYTSISIDPWSNAELEAVLQRGADFLDYQLPLEARKGLAKVARGSISALQAIAAHYYLDQIEDLPQYQKANEGQKATIASQAVATERAAALAKTLVDVANWGAKDALGRPLVSFVVEALLLSTPEELRRGFTDSELKVRVDALTHQWATRTKSKPTLMSASEFGQKIKYGWMAHQIEKNNTPLIVYDRHINRITVNDSMLVFVHTAKPTLLQREFANCVARATFAK